MVDELDGCGGSMASGDDEMHVGFHGQNRGSRQFQSVNSSAMETEGNTNATVIEGDTQQNESNRA